MWLRILIFLAVIALAEYYSFIVVKSAVRTLPQWLNTSIISLYLAMTCLAWIGLIFFRQINWATLPHLLRNVYISFVMGMMVGKILILVVLLLDDVRRLVMLGVNAVMPAKEPVATPGSGGISRSVFLNRLALLLGGTALAGFVYGISNRYNYHVRRIKIPFANLPAAFKGFKIVQLSDIHTGSFDNHLAVEKGIRAALKEQGDLILFTGDLVNNKADEVDEKYQEIFSRLSAPMGVYSVLGNHDYGDYVAWPTAEEKKLNLDKLKALQGAMGWRLLMNEHVLLERGADKIALIGIENWGAKANFPKYGNMQKACEGLPENIFRLLMSHDPSHWDAQVRTEYPDVDLTLSGHTHGMQFGVDSKWLKWSPIQYIYKEWAGLYKEGRQHLYVNRGFGFLGYPGRLGILPEITVIELV